MKCPICNHEMRESKVNFPISIGNIEKITHIYSQICPECGYDENDKRNKKIISSAITESLISCSNSILQQWKKQNRSFSEIERCFVLPARTLSKWLNLSVKPSAAAVELLRIINAFPWMEKVADLGFETAKAKQYVRNYYLSEFNDYNKQISYKETPSEHIYTAVIKKTDSYKAKQNENIFVDYGSMEYVSY